MTSLIDSVDQFNMIYDISITEKDMNELRKSAIRKLTDLPNNFKLDGIEGQKLVNLKQLLSTYFEKYNTDISILKLKISKFEKNIAFENIHLSKLESKTFLRPLHNSLLTENYQAYLQNFETLNERIEILKDTQAMINKEIWRKKQILKVMYTNKSFSKTRPKNQGNSKCFALKLTHFFSKLQLLVQPKRVLQRGDGASRWIHVQPFFKNEAESKY